MDIVKFVHGEGFKTVEGGKIEIEPLNEKNHPNWFQLGSPVNRVAKGIFAPKNLDLVTLRGALTTLDNLMVRIQIEKCKEGGEINCKS